MLTDKTLLFGLSAWNAAEPTNLEADYGGEWRGTPVGGSDDKNTFWWRVHAYRRSQGATKPSLYSTNGDHYLSQGIATSVALHQFK